MAGLAVAADCDLQQDRVLVAISAHFDDRLRLAGGVALAPERLAGT